MFRLLSAFCLHAALLHGRNRKSVEGLNLKLLSRPCRCRNSTQKHLTQLSIFPTAAATQNSIDTAKSHPRKTNRRRKIMTVWSSLVVLFSVVENMHINSAISVLLLCGACCFCCFYNSPYYAAGSSTFPIVFMLLPCRVA